MSASFLGGLIRHAPGALAVADHAGPRLAGMAMRASFVLGKGGHGRITGTVTVAGAGAARKVRLYDLLTGQLVDETWSAADGSYVFDYLDQARTYQVVAHDHMAQYNAAVADLVVPEQMP